MKSVPSIAAELNVTFVRFAFANVVPLRLALVNHAPVRSAPAKFEFARSTPRKLAPFSVSPEKLAFSMLTPLPTMNPFTRLQLGGRLAGVPVMPPETMLPPSSPEAPIDAPLRFAPVKVALVKRVPTQLE